MFVMELEVLSLSQNHGSTGNLGTFFVVYFV